MQAQRRIYDHAPPEIPIPVEFRNAPLEVLFLRMEEPLSVVRPTGLDANSRVRELLASSPVTLSAVALDTRGFRFDREEANAR